MSILYKIARNKHIEGIFNLQMERVIDMRDYEQDFDDTCKLMRKYMEQNRPQSFASVWSLFMKQRRRCNIYGIKTQSVADICEYAKRERIERFGFTG